MEFCLELGACLLSLEEGVSILEQLECALEHIINRYLVLREAVLEPFVRLLTELKKVKAKAREAILVSRT